MNLGYIRSFYLDKILKYLDNTDLIKVLIGQRRAGKSYIMKQIIDFLLNSKNINPKNIIYINLEIDYFKYSNITDLDNFIMQQIKENNLIGRIYLFVDEIQEINGWEKLINSYRANDNLDIDIFITGSNANLLSSDLSTYLAGRYIDFEILPFSYLEYLGYFGLQNTSSNLLSYINTSGIPELYKIEDDEGKINFLKSLKDSVILKDIVKKYNIKEIDLLERLFFYISGNIGNLFSINSIVKKLNGLQVKTNTNTIGDYISFLEKTYIIHGVNRYDLKGKRILEGQKKYYLNDLAFNNYFSSDYDIGGGKKLENIVYNYLRQNGYTIYVGNMGNLEIDFVAIKGKKKLYIQVAYLITDENVFEREFGNLIKIKDNYEKIVLSLDEILISDYKGIIHKNIKDFLTT